MKPPSSATRRRCLPPGQSLPAEGEDGHYGAGMGVGVYVGAGVLVGRQVGVGVGESVDVGVGEV